MKEYRTTKEQILYKLNIGTAHTATNHYTPEQLNEFTTFYLDKWDENTSEDIVAEALIDFFWNKIKVRRCSVCNKLTQKGFSFVSRIDDTNITYCSEGCLHKDFRNHADWVAWCRLTNNDNTFNFE